MHFVDAGPSMNRDCHLRRVLSLQCGIDATVGLPYVISFLACHSPLSSWMRAFPLRSYWGKYRVQTPRLTSRQGGISAATLVGGRSAVEGGNAAADPKTNARLATLNQRSGEPGTSDTNGRGVPGVEVTRPLRLYEGFKLLRRLMGDARHYEQRVHTRKGIRPYLGMPGASDHNVDNP